MYLARYVTAVRENLLLDSHTAESRDEAKANKPNKMRTHPRARRGHSRGHRGKFRRYLAVKKLSSVAIIGQ